MHGNADTDFSGTENSVRTGAGEFAMLQGSKQESGIDSCRQWHQEEILYRQGPAPDDTGFI
jgi:hypothetical protein